MSGSSSDDPFNVDQAICPVDAVPTSVTDVTAQDVLAGQQQLSALTGAFMPANASTNGQYGATVITGGGSNPIETRDYAGRGANPRFGYMGEQDMAFWYGAAGMDVLLGPSGAGGKQSNARGLDMLGWDSVNGKLVVPDNKVSQTPQDINSCTALVENLRPNLETARQQVPINHPDRNAIDDLLRDALAAIDDPANNRWPTKVELTITNAGGFATDVTEKLQEKFAKMYPGLETEPGKPVRLGFTNMQPPATMAAAQQGAAKITAQAQPIDSGPSTYVATPMKAELEPFLGLAAKPPPTKSEIASAGVQAAPVLLDWAEQFFEWVAPKMGIKDAAHTAIVDKMREIAPYLTQHPDRGALLDVHQHVYQQEGQLRPTYELESVFPYYAPTPAEAYQIRLSREMLEDTTDSPFTAIDTYYWVKDGAFQAYMPSSDRLLPEDE